MLIEDMSPQYEQTRDYQEVADLMLRSWAENTEQPLLYTKDFLRSCLNYPGVPQPRSISIRVDGELAAFVCGLPRRAIFSGKPVSLLLMTFLTVAPGCKGQGLGKSVFAECTRQAREDKLDGVIHYCVDGNRSNDVTIAAMRHAGENPVRIMSIPYLIKFLKPDPNYKAETCHPNVGLFLKNARIVSSQTSLSRLWTEAEGYWQCISREGAVSIDDGMGVLTGYEMSVADKNRTKCIFVEDVLWHESEPRTRTALLDRFLGRCSQSAQVAIVPMLGYTSYEPFLQRGFRKSTRLLHAYLTIFEQPVKPVRSMYMDVL